MRAPVSQPLPGSSTLGRAPRLALIASVSAVGALWLLWKGPVPVLRGITPLPELTPFWYMESAFIVLGMLVADLADEVRIGVWQRSAAVLVIQLAVLVLVSNLRFDGQVPISGHAALFSFFIVRRLTLPTFDSNLCRAQFAVAAVTLVVVIYVKIVWWSDAMTLTAGILFGCLVALPDIIKVLRSKKSKRPC